MKRKIICLTIAGILSCSAIGCNSGSVSETAISEQSEVAQQSGNADIQTETESITNNTLNTTDERIENEEDDPIEPAEVAVTVVQPMDYSCWQISIDGLEEYTELAGDAYTDTPAEGNVYLLLYLKIKNNAGHDDYFNYNNLTAQLDGNDVETTYLVNSPHQYSSLYTDLPDNEATGGYLVWEVPTDWQELSVTYTGFEAQDHVRPVIQVSRDDLSAPADYDPLYYY